jgi:hypothetical protein
MSCNDHFPVVHALALRGHVKQLPGDHAELEHAGLVRATPDGFILTEAGYSHHRTLLERERSTLDVTLLELVYERFSGIARIARASRNTSDLAEAVTPLEPILHRTAEIAPRFAQYVERLRNARHQLLDGRLEYGTSANVESIVTVVRELQEDYLQTLGEGYDELDV